MIFSPQKQKFVDAATDMFGGGAVLNKQNVRDASAKAGVPKETATIIPRINFFIF